MHFNYLLENITEKSPSYKGVAPLQNFEMLY